MLKKRLCHVFRASFAGVRTDMSYIIYVVMTGRLPFFDFMVDKTAHFLTFFGIMCIFVSNKRAGCPVNLFMTL